MKKRGFLALALGVFFVLFSLNVFSDEPGNETGSGQSTVEGNDIHGTSTADVCGVFVPE